MCYLCLQELFKLQKIMSNKIYPIGIQNFEKLRLGGYFYIDKTALIYKMVKTGSYYFLSRPRRFGKSLLISTLEAYFQGKKELFEGLAMEKLEKEWRRHPILHMDLNIGKYDTPDSLDRILNKALTDWEAIYGTGAAETTLALRFAGIIKRAYEQTGERVVILVDEYDKPMLQAINNEALQAHFRDTLKPFYGVLKTMDGCIRFGMLTGVTKFGKVSVFSDLNNLEDISLNRNWASLCGITEEELHSGLKPAVEEMAESNGLTYEETLDRLKEMYDGYHFDRDSIGVYNPFSLLNALKNKQFNDYWFETGTPSFLVEMLKRTNYELKNLAHEEQTSDMLNSIDSVYRNPVPLLYQSGYLTIKGYDERFRMYKLGFPNQEVENGFVRYLLPYYSPKERGESEFFIQKFIQEVERGDAEAFMERLQTMFADNSYQVMGKMELYFQNCMYVIFKMMGFYTEVERTTHRGRIDIVIKTSDYIYVMEIKLDGSADEALRQIHEKGYAEPYRKDGRKVFLVGVDFSSDTKGVEEWKIEE